MDWFGTEKPHVAREFIRTRPSPGLRPPSPRGRGLVVLSSGLWSFDQDIA